MADLGNPFGVDFAAVSSVLDYLSLFLSAWVVTFLERTALGET
ncbi:hypothetical protein [Natronorubrum sp. DTA28]